MKLRIPEPPIGAYSITRTKILADTTKPSLTEQSHKESCDINYILSHAQETQLRKMTNPPTAKPIYGDFSDVPSLAEAQAQLAEAHDAFLRLPSKVRERFKNDPLEILSFLQDPSNRDEAVAIGIIPKPPLPETVDPVKQTAPSALKSESPTG